MNDCAIDLAVNQPLTQQAVQNSKGGICPIYFAALCKELARGSKIALEQMAHLTEMSLGEHVWFSGAVKEGRRRKGARSVQCQRHLLQILALSPARDRGPIY